MRKISWEDYPSTATPINADNLNAMQDNIETEIEGKTQKDIITIYLDNTITNPIVETYTKIPLTLKTSVGNKLTVSNNGILIGSGVNHVKVSGKVELDVGNITMSRFIRIAKGNNIVDDNNSISWCANDCRANTSTFLTLPEVIAPVNSGDIINLFYYVKSGDKIAGHSTMLRTYLTVEVVD